MYQDARMFAENQRNVHNGDYRSTVINKHSPLLEMVGSWEKNGRLPKGEIEHRKAVMAMVIENLFENVDAQATQAGFLINESAGTSTANLSPYAQTILPLLLNVFPNLIGHELFSIQPMSGPLGLVYYYDHVYATNKGSIQAGTRVMGPDEQYSSAYSSEEIDGEMIGTGDGVKWGGAGAPLTYTTAFSPVYPNTNTNASPVRRVQIIETTPAGVAVQTATDDGNGGFVGDVSGGSIDYATGAITGFLFAAAVGNGNRVHTYYWYRSEGNENIAEMSFEVRSKELRVEDRQLRATWSLQSAEDLRRQHGMDGHATMVAGISNLIAYDIDRMMISRARAAATTSASWDQAGATAGESQIDYYATLITTITQVGARMHTKNKRMAPVWAVTSPIVAAIIDQLQKHGDYAPVAPTTERDASYGAMNSDFGVQRMGLISKRIRLYQDPNFRQNEILLGAKGNDYLSSGAVYGPYSALTMTPAFADPADGKMKRRFMSRDAFTVVRPEFYGIVTIANLNAPA